MVYATVALAFVMLFASGYGKIKQGNALPIIGSAFVLCLFAGLRSLSFGPDLFAYQTRYISYVPYVTYSTILMQYRNGRLKDGLFYIIMKFFADIGVSYRFFITLVTGLYIVAVSALIAKKSKSPMISFMMFVSLSWLQFSFTGLRQTIAMGLCAISLMMLLNNRKSIIACCLIVVAGFAHSSAWIFLIAPIISWLDIKIGRLGFILLTCISLLLSIIGTSFFRNLVAAIAWNDTLANYASSSTSLNWTGFIIQVMFAAISYAFYDSAVRNDKDIAYLYTLMSLGVGLQAFSSVVAEMFRMSMYFSIASICVYPTAINEIPRKRYRSFAFYLSVALLVYYFFKAAKFAAYTPII